ncbi:hypothetical protein SJ05684_b57760 (plasmid) [Sinorhizobium sojae CCBAU 05684]|uniref:DUF2059 domain-containing protein n=1 Tax=Sinorhizobium sojae CCBAU 05684 TaxID=716928 RepID=A0A249PLF2_9HYPH|nr:hypothetical protein [Sinorhizobium sojae]ASY66758.1 hypothetical protein SJ05684_b57760 [Sinorhizobium sojae CCBAU 05684]
MVLMDYLSKSHRPERSKGWPAALTALVCVLVGCAPVVADASNSIDGSLLRIEQVASRLSSVPSAVATVEDAATAAGISGVSEAAAILRLSVDASFDADAMAAEVAKAVEEIDGQTVDGEALAHAAAAIEEGRTKVAQIYQAQDQMAAKDIEARLSDAKSGASIQELTQLMAAPDLAVETAITSQLMYVAMGAFSDSGTADLVSASKDRLSAEAPTVISALRARNENQKPMPKDAARLDETARLSFVLATLSTEDLSVLLKFYRSAGGKAKRRALVDSYAREMNQANAMMLQAYFSALANYLKTHPRPSSD